MLEKKANPDRAEQEYKREAYEQSERAGEWAQRMSERVYCRIHDWLERRRELVVYLQYTILFLAL